MDFSFYDLPKKHIIIDNFLSNKLANECLKEFIFLEPFYENAQMVNTESLHPDCDECKNTSSFLKKFNRENSLCYLNKIYKERPYSSIIIKSLIESLKYDSPLDIFCKSLSGFFSLLPQINTSEIQVSRYGNCEFYGIHTDVTPHNPETRILTLVYYVNKEPIEFNGGDLIIYSDNMNSNLKLKPKHNRAVIFESKTNHAVDTVELDGNFEHGRFSANVWLGFNNIFKFRN